MGDGFSVILGLVTGGFYILLVYVSFRLALGQTKQSFMLFVFGGMAFRLFVAVAAIAMIIALVPVKQIVFLAAFFGIFGMILLAAVLGGGSAGLPGRHSCRRRAAIARACVPGRG